jgi:ribosomal protein S18 acetylase RimI-like enzyme
MSDDIAYTVIPEPGMPPHVDAAIRDLLCRCFPPDVPVFSQTRCWHGSSPAWSVVATDAGGRVVGHVGVVVRTVRVGDARPTVAGIQNLAVAPELRGAGVGLELMTRAMAEASRRGIAHGLLFCVPKLGKYYQAQGWTVRDVETRMDFNGAVNVPIPGKNICMTIGLAGVPFPEGNIHLAGPDW